MTDANVISIVGKIMGSWSLLLIVFGVVLNILVFLVIMKSKKLRSFSTFQLLAVGAINDLITSLAWNQENFTDTFFNFKSYYRSLFYCEVISVFLEFSTLTFESWMLVSISLDRYLSLRVKKWTKEYFGGVRPVIWSLIMALIIIAINFRSIFNSGYVLNINGTEKIVCFENPPDDPDPWYQTMDKIYFYFGAFIPFGLLLLFNCGIVYEATRFNRARNTESVSSADKARNRKKAEMTRSILIITFLYIVVVSPSAVVAAYFYHYFFTIEIGAILIALFNNIQFSYPAFNFFILYFSNKAFAKEARSLFKRSEIVPKTASSSVLNATNTNDLVE